ncbi:MAG: ATP phosphoribosyltransferase regulatory subunit [Gammaproteobacteria bacterium]|nr:ATP phosphoribosyltransferase regulatory subunit [Gammaproteobacteria bacterium]
MNEGLKPGSGRWLLPEGIEEVLPSQARYLEKVRQELFQLFDGWGYDLVIPPLVEFLDSLLVGTGNDLELQTFKLTDQISGRLMGVRADLTPQVARIEAHHLKNQGPTRLCYIGEVLRTRSEGFGRNRSPLQVGAELYGHSGVESDFEVLQLMVESLSTAGITNAHVDLGHVTIFRLLADAAGLKESQEKILFSALQRKAKPEIKEFLDQVVLDKQLHRMLSGLADLNGAEDVLLEARELFEDAPEGVLKALDELQWLADAMKDRYPALPLYFDLAELRGYKYQTGVVFAAFVPGHGQEVARGGRYDDIGQAFGRARPATGFSMDLKTVVALTAASIEKQTSIFAPCSSDPELMRLVNQLRQQGDRIINELPGQKVDFVESGCDRILANENGIWKVLKLPESIKK